jgi:hypothetical protein
MKSLKIVTIITLIACIVVFLLTITDFMALHDIFNEYVSPKAVDRAFIRLPESSNTSMEWNMVNISYAARFLFLIFNIGVLIYFQRKISAIKTTDGK